MRYWRLDGRKRLGPFLPEELAHAAGFEADSLVCPEGKLPGDRRNWKPAREFRELAALLKGTNAIPDGLAELSSQAPHGPGACSPAPAPRGAPWAARARSALGSATLLAFGAGGVAGYLLAQLGRPRPQPAQVQRSETPSPAPERLATVADQQVEASPAIGPGAEKAAGAAPGAGEPKQEAGADACRNILKTHSHPGCPCDGASYMRAVCPDGSGFGRPPCHSGPRTPGR
ncbi:MAG: hypothetical protein HY554_00545 [Elusimicrobia bacterium]|nr:hypothetical protein [Elusimicrobiota bacterium]